MKNRFLTRADQSLHSRAAKRETSPSIDTDKSLKIVKPPAESTSYRPSILSVHQGSGVVKASKNGRKAQLSARARRKQVKGLDRAEAVMDKTALRLEQSKMKALKIQERRKRWEDLNKKMIMEEPPQATPVSSKEKLMDLDKDSVQTAAVPHLDSDVLSGVQSIQIQSPPSLGSTTALPSSGNEDEEIL